MSVPASAPQPALNGKYVGRFAPSPTGALHAGSIAAALASYLDARAHQGQWLIRIEDIDPPRESVGAVEEILLVLSDLEMTSQAPVSYQSANDAQYRHALHQLAQQGRLFPCECSRRRIAQYHAKHESTSASGAYPGLCRQRSHEQARIKKLVDAPTVPKGATVGPALRLRVDEQAIHWHDRPAGYDNGQPQTNQLSVETGDFVIRRSDSLWSYQLAVVVDDQAQGITDIVRGADLVDSTARQLYLQQCLGYRRPRYLHLPLIMTASGDEKLSKQTGAPPVRTDVSTDHRIELLNQALAHFGLPGVQTNNLTRFWELATERWGASDWIS